MKLGPITFLLALLIGAVRPQIAQARLGDSLDQLKARYGGVVSNSLDDMVNASADYLHLQRKMYTFAYQGGHITATVWNSKTISETYDAPTNNPHLTDEACLAMASTISAHTNWSKTSLVDKDYVWVADYTMLEIDHNVDGPDEFTIEATKFDSPTSGRVITNLERRVEAEQAKLAEPPPPTADERVLASQQALADKGDPYGERQMGLRYRDGHGVPADAAKARELLQKAADQGDQEAAQALDSFKNITPPADSLSFATTNPPQVTIDSAIFAWKKKSADVTQKVIDLMHDNPDGFTVDRGTLGVDPAPGKGKILTVIYEYNGQSHTIRIRGGDDLDYGTLIDHVSKPKPAE